LNLTFLFAFLGVMTFLNPFVLIALAAAALPLLLHLLTLRKLRTIEFSSVRFLKELQKTSLRRLRFRQILLLIIRTLLVAAIVLAFARPALRGSLGSIGQGDTPATMIIVIDDSPSMDMRDPRGSSIARARARALAFLDAAGERDHVLVLPLSQALTKDFRLPTLNPDEARRAVEAVQTSAVSIGLGDGIKKAIRLLEASQDANREIMVVTDGQASQWRTGSAPGDSAQVPATARVFVSLTPSERTENSGVTEASIENRLIAPGQQVRLRAHLVSSGSTRGKIVRVGYDGRTAAQKPLGPGSTEDLGFSIVPRKAGLGTGVIEIDDEGIPGDNRRFFAMNTPARLRVLLVGPDAEATRLAALSLQPMRDSLAARDFSIRRIIEKELTGVSLDSVAVIILCGVAGPSPADGLRLARFVREGGGLIHFPGPATQPALLNGNLLGPLGIPPSAAQPLSASESAPISFGHVDRAHPVFEGLFEARMGGRPPGIESPRILKALPPAAGERGRSIIGLPGGGSFLADYSCGRGRVMLFAVDAGLAWSDLALKGIFPPLMHRSALFCGAAEGQPSMITAGDDLTFSLRSRMIGDRDQFLLVRPSGSTEKVLPEISPSDASARFRCGSAAEQGIYRLTRTRGPGPGETVAAAAVNLRADESDVSPLSDGGCASFLNTCGIPPGQVRVLRDTDSPEQIVRTARIGTELWKLFAVLALALAVAEMIIGRAPHETHTKP
jgi:hypothetical protein